MKECVLIIVGMVLFFVGLWFAVITMDKISCTQYGQETSREVKFRYMTGCYVKTDNGWFNRDQLRDAQ